MMWNKINRAEDAPAGHSIKDTVIVNLSEYIWLITRDDGTSVCVAGLYRQIAVGGDNIVWLAPYPALSAKDWRGLRRLFDVLKAGAKRLTAIVDTTNPAAVRVVEHLNFALVSDGPERIYKWPS